MPASTMFEVTLSPSISRIGFPRVFAYVEVKIRDVENLNDVHHAFYVNDGILHSRLMTLVGGAEASRIIAGLHRGETIRLPSCFTKQQLLDVNAYRRELRSA